MYDCDDIVASKLHVEDRACQIEFQASSIVQAYILEKRNKDGHPNPESRRQGANIWEAWWDETHP